METSKIKSDIQKIHDIKSLKLEKISRRSSTSWVTGEGIKVSYHKGVDDEGREYFIVDGDIVHSKTLDQKDKIIDYSWRNNNIVEIYSIQKNTVCTKYYPDYYPLMIINVCNFYSNKITEESIRNYSKILSNTRLLRYLFNSVTNELLSMLNTTGFCFNDTAPNNILMNYSSGDFRIIDVMSIAPDVKIEQIINLKMLIGRFHKLWNGKTLSNSRDKVVEKYNKQTIIDSIPILEYLIKELSNE